MAYDPLSTQYGNTSAQTGAPYSPASSAPGSGFRPNTPSGPQPGSLSGQNFQPGFKPYTGGRPGGNNGKGNTKGLNGFLKFLLWLLVLGAIGYGAYIFMQEEPVIKNIEHSQGGTLNGPIIAFGDSLVYGVGASKKGVEVPSRDFGNDFSPGTDFISLLSDSINEPILNFGKSGDTTAGALQRLNLVTDEKPRLVIVLLGGNDYLKQVSDDVAFANLQTIVTKLQNEGAAVLLLGVRGGLLKDRYEEQFKAFAKENQVGFVPNVLDGLIGDVRLMSDTIHPNDAGYKIIAEKVLPELKYMIGKK